MVELINYANFACASGPVRTSTFEYKLITYPTYILKEGKQVFIGPEKAAHPDNEPPLNEGWRQVYMMTDICMGVALYRKELNG